MIDYSKQLAFPDEDSRGISKLTYVTTKIVQGIMSADHTIDPKFITHLSVKTAKIILEECEPQ